MALGLPSDHMIKNAGIDPKAPVPADVSHPSLRHWLETLPAGHAAAAAFETKLRFSPGGSTGTIEREFRRAGYRTVAKAQKFVVTTPYGPLREGEEARARAWGGELASSIR